ncbi:antibiotic biosynthesis monooxygenase family protein [Labrys wisconsinensis]|uniref:Heme-degrading monooxygenase HmoA n=1 Tax=Labrys wisconsinensis TaxID=425677 RepID=A0ABU0J5T8_9HYPH|nr:antibiotic biosynthesis monooxygenase [Labrys wisconsinensis]MDQ0469623.1 heme-degrading monooxygenase HmoA [Labrys wisconsinensis]
MFIAMNRFTVKKGCEAEFESVWRQREVHIDIVPGFVEFHLLRGPEREDHTLYSSHVIWRNKADFEAWTKSEAFRLAHRDAGKGPSLTTGHPVFEGFEVIQTTLPRVQDAA